MKNKHGEPAYYNGTILPTIEIRAWSPNTNEWLPVRMTEAIHTAIKDYVISEMALSVVLPKKENERC